MQVTSLFDSFSWLIVSLKVKESAGKLQPLAGPREVKAFLHYYGEQNPFCPPAPGGVQDPVTQSLSLATEGSSSQVLGREWNSYFLNSGYNMVKKKHQIC